MFGRIEKEWNRKCLQRQCDIKMKNDESLCEVEILDDMEDKKIICNRQEFFLDDIEFLMKAFFI